MQKLLLGLICALPCEASILIQKLNLRLIEAKPFPLYQNKEISLIVSGVGKIWAASATSYLFSKGLHSFSCLLNIGVAGTFEAPLGTLFMGHKISDSLSKACFYPNFLFQPLCKTKEILTHQTPNTQYQKEILFDMEASAICQVANRFITIDAIHFAKMISDTFTFPSKEIEKKKIEFFIQSNFTSLKEIIDQLLILAKKKKEIYALPSLYDELLKMHHFSETEKNQLLKLVRFSISLGIEKEIPFFSKEEKGKKIIQTLEQLIEKTPIIF